MSQSVFIREARSIGKRSNCAKRKLGTVLVKNGKIISRGWNTCCCNGHPRDEEVPKEDCLRLNLHGGRGYELSHAVHAEVSALLNIRRQRDAADYERCKATIEPTQALIEELFTEEERELLRGATLYLSGHTYACDGCKRWCSLLRIREIIIEE